jgi:hypothetical protein
MAQFVFVIRYPLNNDPAAEPYDVNLYTTDQEIVWKNLIPNTQWSTKRPVPIVFDQAWFTAGGKLPTALTGPDGAPLWTAIGPGAVTTALSYTYEIYLEPSGGGDEFRVTKKRALATGEQILVDPDVWNQPQP